MKKILFIATIILFSVSNLPVAVPIEDLGICKGAQNNVIFMTGGVGIVERAKMRIMAETYNLKIVLADVSGAYLSRVPVAIFEEDGNKLLDIVTNGPWLYARLPDGKYTIKAAFKGNEKKRIIQMNHEFNVTMFHWHLDSVVLLK